MGVKQSESRGIFYGESLQGVFVIPGAQFTIKILEVVLIYFSTEQNPALSQSYRTGPFFSNSWLPGNYHYV